MAEVVSGQWWQPTDPKESWHGVLSENEGHAWVLDLVGMPPDWWAPTETSDGRRAAKTFRPPGRVPILNGRTDRGKTISLVDCLVIGANVVFGPSRGTARFSPSFVVHGVHLDGPEDFRFTSLSVRYSNMDTWVATSGFTVQFDSEHGYPSEVRFSLPESAEVTLPDGVKVGVEFAASSQTISAGFEINEVRIVQQTWIRVASGENLLFDHLVRRINKLQDLISLSVGVALKPLEIGAICNARDETGIERPVPVQIVSNREPIAPGVRDVAWHEMLFTFPEIRGRLSSVIRSWFSQGEALQSLYELYFGTLRSSSMYVEHRFLNMFQALESYHRRTFMLNVEEAEAHKERIDSILKPHTGKDRKWLKGQLKHSHEPMAVDRIKYLVKKLNAAWLLNDTDIHLAADFRNYYTHFNPEVEKRLPAKSERFLKMHNLAVRLRVLCELVLLDAIGFSSDEARNRVQRARRLDRHLVRS